MKLFFVRHGQTHWNVEKKLQGQLDSPLTKDGINQTIALKNNIDDIDFDIIYSSPLGRAADTATILKRSNTNLILLGELKEMSFGKIEGMQKNDILKEFPNELNNLWHDTEKYNPLIFQGETYLDLEKRAIKALKIILSQNKNSLIVTHGVMLKVIFKIIKKQNWKEMEKEDFPHNTSITTVEYANNEFLIMDFSNIDHLAGFELDTFV